MKERMEFEHKFKQKGNQLKQNIFICITFILFFFTASLFAGGLINPGNKKLNNRAINLANLALMRAEKFNQIPKKIVE